MWPCKTIFMVISLISILWHRYSWYWQQENMKIFICHGNGVELNISVFNETGYLIPLVETVGVNQQGKRAIALAPCFLAPTVSTRGIKYPCFILTRYLMHCLINQRQVKVSLLKTLSKCSCWKFWAKKTRYLFGQWESLFHIKYIVKCLNASSVGFIVNLKSLGIHLR